MNNPEAQGDSIRPVRPEDSASLLAWRNDESVRRYMFDQGVIAPEVHDAWFEAARRDPHRHLLIVQSESEPIGFVDFRMIRGGPVCEWGFYVAPGSPRGTGTRLGNVAIPYAFTELDAHKICGQAIAYNTASIRFHEKMGFKREGRLRDQFFDGSRYHDVICFGLLKDDWEGSR